MPPTRMGLARPVCSFCDDPSACPDNEVTSELRHKFFHRECSTCDPQQDRALCDFCQHLRIRHLFCCELTSDLFQFDLNISPSQSCPFCQLLTHIIHLQKSYFPRTKEDINKGCMNICLRLELDIGLRMKRDLKLCVGSVFYPIFSHEDIYDWDENEGEFLSNDLLQVGKQVQWDQVRVWLGECGNGVGWCEEGCLKLDKRLRRLPDGFMLIDVKERKIVDGDKDFQFVALSYVWGDKPNDAKLRATEKTIKRLRCRNSVAAHELPATIEDAIQICIKLGERYLWVDRLCIVQDQHQTKQHQINRMASIYASASFVIVVTEGDMESGIAGVSHHRPVQYFRSFSGSTFSYGLPSIGESIEHSRWATRGWTYQEAVLARKKLFFTPNQVYYMCESTIRSENMDKPYKQSSFTEISMKLHPYNGRQSVFEDWKHHLEAYTARSLSHSSDVYNAFTGICSAIYIEDDPLLCGLPRQNFDQALLWRCTKPAENAPPHQIRTPEKDEQLPSWSWSSVSGKVSLDRYGAHFCGSLVEWAVKRSGHSHLERVWRPKSSRTWLSPNQFYLGVAWSQGCLKKPWPFPQLFELEFSRLQQFIKTRWTSVDDFSRDHIWGWDKDLDEKLLKELMKKRWLLDKTLLLSRAQTARFRLMKHRPHSAQFDYLDEPDHYLLEVVDEEGHCIGMLAESEPRVKDRAWPDTEFDTFEFVALSISHCDYYNFRLRCVLQRDEELLKAWWDSNNSTQRKEKLRGIFRQRSRNITFYDRYGNPLDPIPIVNVMLIGRDRRHSHLAHRVSVGWILLAQWARAERQFKTIILE